MALFNGTTITGEEMDVLDKVWGIFESVEIKWSVLAIRGGFINDEHAKNYYDDIGQVKTGKFNITRRDLKTVAGLSGILGNVKIDWNRVAVRCGFRDEVTAKAHHRDMAELENRPHLRPKRLKRIVRTRLAENSAFL